MSDIKLIIDGTEYKINQMPYPTGASSTPVIFFKEKAYIGEAILQERNFLKDWEIITHKGSSVDNSIFIFSVKRLSDNEIFTKGDHFMYKSRDMLNSIEDFIIIKEKMYVRTKGVIAPLELKYLTKLANPVKQTFTKDEVIEIINKHL